LPPVLKHANYKHGYIRKVISPHMQ